MWLADNWKDYEVLDTSAGEKLERWGKYILVRPDPQVIWNTPKDDPLWRKYDARYARSSTGGGKWQNLRLPAQWQVRYKELTFQVKPMNFKHTGVFPEQAANWDFMMETIRRAGRPIRVLNLFAYTGGATIACAAAGASVCHVDAAKGMVLWAKENAKASGLEDRPIRWIVDDCAKFVEREIRRGKTYDAIIMDPPSYGRGPSGEVWKLEENLYPFVELVSRVLSDDPLFFIINSYTTGLAPSVMRYLTETLVANAVRRAGASRARYGAGAAVRRDLPLDKGETMTTAIEVSRLRYAYDAQDGGETHIVFDGLDLSVRQGSFVAILGHNGCGKSTLAKHFNAVLLPSGGSVHVYGMDTKDEKQLLAIRQHVGMVFQNPDNQIVSNVVEEDVAFAPENLGVPSEEIRRRVDDALRAVGMYEYRTYAPQLLSGGQKQRVAIAGVLAMQPQCVVLDEPTAMLDPQGRREVLDTIERLNRENGITVILITHHMDEAVRAGRVIAMSEGKIIADGTPQQVFAQEKLLRSVGLDVPQTEQLLLALRARGVDIPTDALTPGQCARLLRQYIPAV